LVNKITSSSSPKNPTANKNELDQIRAIMGAGYKPGASVLGELGQQYQMKQALEADLKLRDQRIQERNKVLDRQEKQLNQAERNLQSYSKYIKNGEFAGTEKQYNAYKSAYDSYKKLYNRYSSNYQLHKTDIVTFNKNKQSIDSKKPAKKLRKGYSKVSAAYDAANLKLGSKLPTVKQAEPYIREYVRTSTPGGIVASRTDEILGRKDTEKIIQFNLGMYESVKAKPLKAVANFVVFAVGGVAAKGLGAAAKTLGAGAKTAKAAKLIETGALAVYAGSTGLRYAKAEDAREAGFVTGDVIFNELLPAGLGLKYGVKVVKAIPKGAKKIYGDFKGSGSSAFARSERAQVGGSRQKLVTKNKAKAKNVEKTEDELIKEFEKAQRDFLRQEKQLQSAGIIQKTAPALKRKVKTRTKLYDQVNSTNKLKQLNSLESQLKAKSNQIVSLKKQIKNKQKAINTNTGKLRNADKFTPKKLKSISEQVTKDVAKLKLLTRQYNTAVGDYKKINKKLTEQVSRVKQIEKQKQRQKPITLPRGRTKDMAVTEMVQKINEVQKSVQKTIPRPKTTGKTAKEIVPPRIPQMRIPEGTEKKTKRTKKTRTTRRYDSKQFENAVANINSIFG